MFCVKCCLTATWLVNLETFYCLFWLWSMIKKKRRANSITQFHSVENSGLGRSSANLSTTVSRLVCDSAKVIDYTSLPSFPGVGLKLRKCKACLHCADCSAEHTEGFIGVILSGDTLLKTVHCFWWLFHRLDLCSKSQLSLPMTFTNYDYFT